MSRIRTWLGRRRRELRLSVRVTVAGLLALLVAQFLQLPQGYWAVFAAVVVTESSVGSSVQTAFNWMIGTIGGAAYGALVSALLPHGSDLLLAVELVVGLLPLALLAALYPRFRVAPVTAIIVLATINSSTMGPLQSALDRVIEIGIGSVIGLAVSLLVLPSRAHVLVAEAASRALEHMARLLTTLTSAFGEYLDAANVQRIHLDVLAELGRLEDVADEAKRERATRLATAPDPAPLPRTLHRVRNDLVMIGRAAPEPLPEQLMARLRPPFAQTAGEVVKFFRAAGEALRKRRAPPPLDTLDAAFGTFDAALSQMREDQMIRGQNAEIAGRIFALSFAFQQLRANLKDLADRVTERAQS